ncbi:MAG: GTP-binding protein [Pseudomonadota bacterium]
MKPSNPVPFSLLTGFLGAGKTTLLNRLLNEGDLKNTAVIVNEFGDVALDHLLVERGDEDIIELSDGCVCCTVRGALVDTLLDLLDRKSKEAGLGRILVETTGLADPAPLLHTIVMHPVLAHAMRFDGVIAVIDAVNGEATLSHHEEAIKQVALADRIVVSKTDIASPSATDRLNKQIKSINPGAARLVAADIENPVSELLECGLINAATSEADIGRWLGHEPSANAQTHDHGHNSNHDHAIRAFSMTSDKPVTSDALQTFLDLLRSLYGQNLLRLKGIVELAEDPERPLVLHAVQEAMHPPAHLPAWPKDLAGRKDKTRLVAICRGIEPEKITDLFSAFTGGVAVDAPDRTALENNPLRVPGP